MKRSDFLRRIALAYDNCDGDGEDLIKKLMSLECIGTARGVVRELQLAADDLERLKQLEEQIRRQEKNPYEDD
jgi:hypothetical protein